MKALMQNIFQFCKRSSQTFIEAVKVFGSMVLVFAVLAMVGPLTYAAQHIERLF